MDFVLRKPGNNQTWLFLSTAGVWEADETRARSFPTRVRAKSALAAIDRINRLNAAPVARNPDAKPLTEMSLEEYEATVLRDAAYFTAYRRLGRGRSVKEDRVPTLERAMELAVAMGRGAIVYAVTAAGRSVLVDTVR